MFKSLILCAALLSGAAVAKPAPQVQLEKRAAAYTTGFPILTWYDSGTTSQYASDAAMDTDITNNSPLYTFRTQQSADTFLYDATVKAGKVLDNVAILMKATENAAGADCVFTAKLQSGQAAATTIKSQASATGVATVAFGGAALTGTDRVANGQKVTLLYDWTSGTACNVNAQLLLRYADTMFTVVDTPATTPLNEQNLCNAALPIDTTKPNSGGMTSTAGAAGSDPAFQIAELTYAANAYTYTGVRYAVTALPSGATTVGCQFGVRAVWEGASSAVLGTVTTSLDKFICDQGFIAAPSSVTLGNVLKLKVYIVKATTTHQCDFKYRLNYLTAPTAPVAPFRTPIDVTCTNIAAAVTNTTIKNTATTSVPATNGLQNAIYLYHGNVTPDVQAVKYTIESKETAAATVNCATVITWEAYNGQAWSTFGTDSTATAGCVVSGYKYIPANAKEIRAHLTSNHANACTAKTAFSFIGQTSNVAVEYDTTPLICTDTYETAISRNRTVTYNDLTPSQEAVMYEFKPNVTGNVAKIRYMVNVFNPTAGGAACKWNLKVAANYGTAKGENWLLPFENCKHGDVLLEANVTYAKFSILMASDAPASCNSFAHFDTYAPEAPAPAPAATPANCPSTGGSGSQSNTTTSTPGTTTKAAADSISAGLSFIVASALGALALF